MAHLGLQVESNTNPYISVGVYTDEKGFDDTCEYFQEVYGASPHLFADVDPRRFFRIVYESIAGYLNEQREDAARYPRLDPEKDCIDFSFRVWGAEVTDEDRSLATRDPAMAATILAQARVEIAYILEPPVHKDYEAS